eukprot:Em0015g712a
MTQPPPTAPAALYLEFKPLWEAILGSAPDPITSTNLVAASSKVSDISLRSAHAIRVAIGLHLRVPLCHHMMLVHNYYVSGAGGVKIVFHSVNVIIILFSLLLPSPTATAYSGQKIGINDRRQAGATMQGQLMMQKGVKRELYQRDLEENRAANRKKYKGNSASILASKRRRFWKNPGAVLIAPTSNCNFQKCDAVILKMNLILMSQMDSNMEANFFSESMESEDEVQPPTPLLFTPQPPLAAMTATQLPPPAAMTAAQLPPPQAAMTAAMTTALLPPPLVAVAAPSPPVPGHGRWGGGWKQ